VTEAEGLLLSQKHDMLFVYNILKSLGLKVQLPMVLEMDNKGAVNLANIAGVLEVAHVMLMCECISSEI
jgi:uncharacterized protein (UPF0216 family)